MKSALVLGKGGFGIQLAEWLLCTSTAEKIVFLDDNASGCAGKLRDFSDPALQARCGTAFVGLGNNALRVELLQALRDAGYETPVFLHPQAAVSPSAVLGAGTVVLPFAYVGAGVKAGPGCLLNAGAIIDHNSTLGVGVHIAPGGIVKAGAVVPDLSKVDSGEIIQSPWGRP